MNLPQDPSLHPVPCEICQKSVPIGESYSFVVVFATTGPRPHPEYGVSSFQCSDESNNIRQHFACSIEHAEQAAVSCIHEHLIPAHVQKVRDNQARFQQDHTAPATKKKKSKQ